MKNSLKGALLSGFVFPGLGQMSFRHFKRGIALVLIVLVGLTAIIAKALQRSFAILDKIQSEGGAIDARAISEAAVQATTASDSLTMNVLLPVIIICWVFGIVDAYRIGKRKDVEEGSGAA